MPPYRGIAALVFLALGHSALSPVRQFVALAVRMTADALAPVTRRGRWAITLWTAFSDRSIRRFAERAGRWMQRGKKQSKCP